MAIDLLGLSVSSPLLVPFSSSSSSSSSSSALTSDTRFRSNYLTSSSQLHVYPRRVDCCRIFSTETFPSLRSATDCTRRRKLSCIIPGSASSSPPDGGEGESKASDQDKVPFGYSRKDILLIGVGVTAIGVGLKSGLEFVGVDPLQAGNVVQLVMVLGLTVGWISTYIFRVSNKEMTYAQQLRDYENKVIQKRLEGLTEAELEALLQQVEEEKQQLPRSEQVN